MKKIFLLSLILSCLLLLSQSFYAQAERKELGSLVIENIPDIPQRITEKIFQYQNTRSASFAGWLPDGNGMLIRTRFGETNQVHQVDLPGGARKQLTFFPEPVAGVAVCPDSSGSLFVFAKDLGGNEFYQVYSFNLKTGEYKMLTDGKSRNGGMLWSNKGDKFVYTSTKRNGTDTDIYLLDMKSGKEELLIAEGGEWSALDWSADDQMLIARKYISANESYLYSYNRGSKKLEQINPSKEKISYGDALWSKDGKGIYLISDESDEFLKLRYLGLATKKSTVISKDINWDIEGIEITEKGDKLAFTANEDGISRLYMMDTKTNKINKVPNIPAGEVSSLKFTKAGDRLAFTISNSKTPADIFSLNLRTSVIDRWTFSEVGGLNADNFIEPELIHYPTFDQVDGKPRMIPAFIYKPAKGKGPFPVLINIHGGPEGQSVPGFNSFQQYLLNEMGIAVAVPNVRGSTGYGKTYLAMDNGFKREESVQDIGKLLDWIKEQPDLDAGRVCVYGGSYGGFMVLSSMVNFNDRLKCGIDIVGISNMVTFLEHTQSYRRDLRRAEYGDEREPKMREFLNNIAPANQAGKITKPMFVVQGLNDPRVPVTEAEQMVQKIRENKGAVWYLMAKDEGHGFQKKSNRDFLTNATILFLEENLLK